MGCGCGKTRNIKRNVKAQPNNRQAAVVKQAERKTRKIFL
jgi:hypothetical protein